MKRVLCALALSCFALPALALQCTGGSDFSLRAVTGKIQAPLLSCTLGAERALSVEARIDSSLVRTRALIKARFLDAAGKTLASKSTPPAVGQFRGYALRQHLPVPAGARRVVLEAELQSRAGDATGALELSSLVLKPVVAASLDLSHGGVMTQGQPLELSLSVAGGAAEAEFSVQDVDGRRVLHKTAALAGGRENLVRLDALPTGYYEILCTVAQPGLTPAALRHTLAVIPPGPPPRERRIGLDAALGWYGGKGDALRTAIDRLRLAGVGSVRERFSWSQVQKQPGSQNWAHYLELARQLQSSGLDVVQVFHDSPTWAHLPGAEKQPADRSPPGEKAAYELGRAYAAGLGRHARFVEYWNEQNTGFFKGYPFEYATGLKAFYAGVKSVDPGIGVLLGASAGAPGPFFEQIYRNGAADFIDARNHHFYGKVDAFPAFVASQVLPVEQKAGVAERPAWLTEIGYSLKRDASGGWRAAEREQASYLVKAYAEGLAASYERVFFFLLKELVEDDFHTWGILHEDLSPRPAWQALAVLSRHIEGKAVTAVLRGKGLTSVYFRGADGHYAAIAWGSRIPASAAGPFTTARDIFGRAQGKDARLGGEPLLLGGIRSLPAGVRPVAAAPVLEKNKPATKLRLTATVFLDGSPLPRPDGNAVALPVAEGQELSIEGRLLPLSSGEVGGQIGCQAGPGLQVTGTAVHRVESIPEQGHPYRCSYRLGPDAGRGGFATVHATVGKDQDQIHLSFRPDARKLVAKAARAPALPVDVCGRWNRNAAPNVRLDVKEDHSKGSCALVFGSEVQSSGETWVFPGTGQGLGSLPRATGVRLQVAAVPGTPFPPRPFLLQLAEKGGGIWLVELEAETLGDGRQRLSGLFSEARPAAWAKDADGRLDLGKVGHIMFGWGGYGGQAGQRHAYRLESMQWVVDPTQRKRP